MVVNHDALRRRAFEIWEAEGRPQGRDVEHWLRAEAELKAAGAKTAKKTTAKPAPDKAPPAKSKPRRKATAEL